MSTPGRLSTCGRCGGTIEWSHLPAAPGYVHIVAPADGHAPDPDDSYVSGPSADEAGEEL